MIKAIKSAGVNVDPICMCTGISYVIYHHSISFTKRFSLEFNPPYDSSYEDSLYWQKKVPKRDIEDLLFLEENCLATTGSSPLSTETSSLYHATIKNTGLQSLSWLFFWWDVKLLKV